MTNETTAETGTKTHQKAANTTAATTPKVYRQRDVLRLTSVSVSTLRRWIIAGEFPEPAKVGRLTIWPIASVDEWLQDPLAWIAKHSKPES